jgi:hypothetical protein
VLLEAAEEVLANREAEAKAAAAAAEAEAAAVPEDLAHVADALKRSPLMLTVGGDAPGLAAIAGLVSEAGAWVCMRAMRATPPATHAMHGRAALPPTCCACATPDPPSRRSTSQADDLIVAATVELLREHGLMDAKAMVVEDASVLLAAADKAKVRGAARRVAPKCFALGWDCCVAALSSSALEPPCGTTAGSSAHLPTRCPTLTPAQPLSPPGPLCG